MKKLKNTKETSETKHSCEFCNRSFIRESTLMKHLCEYKHRWLNKDEHGNRIGFQTWLQFYTKNSASTTKNRTYLEFIKSSYYAAFTKFGHYCVNSNVINVARYVDWLLKNQIGIDSWNTDTQYTKFLISHLKDEDPLDAIARSIETTIVLAESDKIQTKDCLRYGNKNRVCYAITTGKISPWMLYHSESGKEFLSKLDETQVKMILDYIQPEQWAIKFKRNTNIVPQVQELLAAGGY
jgi:hypothetical protein